ncbi:MAG: glycosyltransferase [Syntrophaceae bacterium]|nr:glycosyltransferase [Syntrophaceae bacterium]
MRILLSGYHNPRYWTVTEYIERAVRALGHELHVFDDGARCIPGRLRDRSRWMERADRAWLNRRLRARAGRLRPDVLIVLGGELVDPDTVHRARAEGSAAVLWTIDAPWNFSPVLRAAPAYNRIFCQGTEALEILRANGIEGARWLPMGCDPESHCRISDGAKGGLGHDVVFVGSHYPVREQLFAGLAGTDFAIWGPGWERLPPASPLRKHVKGAHTAPAVWTGIYRSAKIVLAPHWRDPRGRVPCHQASPRVFEAMACGAFVLSDRQRDVLALFREGEHLACFGDAAELAAKVRCYLENPGERQRIARQGAEEALRSHTYTCRLRDLLEDVGRCVPGRVAAGAAS